MMHSHNTLRRLSAVLLAAAMALALAIPAFAAGAQDPGPKPKAAAGFSDVSSGSSFRDAILWAAGEGIAGGYDDGTFRPANSVTRAQFCVMLSRAFYPDDVRRYSTKTYTSQGWFVPNTRALYANGVLVNTSFSGSFSTASVMNRNISRYDMAQLMTNIMADRGFSVTTAQKNAARAKIADYEDIPSNYRDAVRTVYALDIIGGYGDGSFQGTVAMNRGQGAAVIYRMWKYTSAASEPKTDKAEETLPVGSGIDDIAQLAALKADVEIYSHNCVVDVDGGANPYDVTWDYGKLYDAFVREVDWDLLFDAGYYSRTFPVLAHLYHGDETLLLRHFQTVGIHEGRQGCAGFNVAAYRKNCGAEVRDAFGDHYECYYFYYAMNQATQKGVTATGKEKKQLTVKLTRMQQTELENINKYRAEVGAAPLEYDPELSALACYRAYIDALEDWDAHDWIQAPENLDEAYGMMDMMKADYWSENTVHGYQRDREYAFRQGPATPWYIDYRNSKSHYEAMIATKYRYVGSANCYISDYKKENPNHPNAVAVYVQYDVFVPNLSTPLHS